MTREDAGRLLDRTVVLKRPCDLDLLVFFARHPRTLLTSEQLAAWLGYELKQIAESLEVLLNTGLLTRSQNPARAARLYVLVIGGTTSEWLPSLLRFASTRGGRLTLLEALGRNRPDRPVGPAGSGGLETSPRPRMVRNQSGEKPDVRTE